MNSDVKPYMMSKGCTDEVRGDFVEVAFGLSLNDEALRPENTHVLVPSAGDGAGWVGVGVDCLKLGLNKEIEARCEGLYMP